MISKHPLRNVQKYNDWSASYRDIVPGCEVSHIANPDSYGVVVARWEKVVLVLWSWRSDSSRWDVTYNGHFTT